MEGCLEKLRSEFEKGDRGGPFELVETFFRFGQPPAYAEAAGKHGMSIPAIKSFLHRARGRFRELVRAEVAGTVSDPREIDSEMAELMRLLAS